jgi:hypothetical protein
MDDMKIYTPTHKASTERGAKTIAKRNPWRLSCRQVIERGAVVDDGSGNWWIYTTDNVANGAYTDGWHKLGPTGAVDKITGEPQPVYLNLYD